MDVDMIAIHTYFHDCMSNNILINIMDQLVCINYSHNFLKTMHNERVLLYGGIRYIKQIQQL